jgi:hypothetical protein
MTDRPVYVKEPGQLSFTLDGREALIPGERVKGRTGLLTFWFDMNRPWRWADGELIDKDDRAQLLRELPDAARNSEVVLYTDAESKRAIEEVLGPRPDIQVGQWSRTGATGPVLGRFDFVGGETMVYRSSDETLTAHGKLRFVGGRPVFSIDRSVPLRRSDGSELVGDDLQRAVARMMKASPRSGVALE